MGDILNTIELNGNLYDTISGKILNVPKHSPKRTGVSTTLSINDITPVQKKRQMHTKKVNAGNIHTKPAHSNTLMRKAVKKPIVKSENASNKVAAKHSMHQNNEKNRLLYAKKTSTNQHISRFGIGHTDTRITPTRANITMRPEPINKDHFSSKTNTGHSATQKLSPLTIHLQKSLEKADAHKIKHPKKPRFHKNTAKRLNLIALSLAVILLTGFIAYQNAGNIAIRIAARKTGFAVTIPGYTPAGYRINSQNAEPGKIVLGYKSNSDSRSYSVTQSVSSWNSEALEANFLDTKIYQTAQNSKGRQIYTYDDTNATWVDHGVWFNLESNTNLGSDQLNQLITSI